MDKTYSPANLHRAFEKVWGNGGSAGANSQTVAHFARHAEENSSGCTNNYAKGATVRNR